jgi:hypothetical protein
MPLFYRHAEGYGKRFHRDFGCAHRFAKPPDVATVRCARHEWPPRALPPDIGFALTIRPQTLQHLVPARNLILRKPIEFQRFDPLALVATGASPTVPPTFPAVPGSGSPHQDAASVSYPLQPENRLAGLDVAREHAIIHYVVKMAFLVKTHAGRSCHIGGQMVRSGSRPNARLQYRQGGATFRKGV